MSDSPHSASDSSSSEPANTSGFAGQTGFEGAAPGERQTFADSGFSSSPATTSSTLHQQPANPLHVAGPLTLGQLIDRAFRLYRNRIGAMLLTAAIFLIPVGILNGWLTGNFMVGYFDFILNIEDIFDPTEPEPDFNEVFSAFSPIASYVALLFLISIVGFVVGGIVNMALTAHSLSAMKGQTLTVGESIRTAASRLWPFIGKSILQGLIIFGATVGFLLILGIIAVAVITFAIGGVGFLTEGFGGGEPNPLVIFGYVMLVLCGYLIALILLFLPTVYFSARYITATVGIVDQNWGPIEALRRSWALSKGKTWRCIGYSVLLFILTLIVVNVPLGVIQQIVTITTAGDFEALGMYAGIFTALTALMSVLWQPFYMAANVLFYTDLRVRQENYDLELRVQQLEN